MVRKSTRSIQTSYYIAIAGLAIQFEIPHLLLPRGQNSPVRCITWWGAQNSSSHVPPTVPRKIIGAWFAERSPLYRNIVPLPPLYHRVLITPNTYKRAVSELYGLITMPGNCHQRCGCYGTQIHTSSPRGSVTSVPAWRNPPCRDESIV